MQLFGLLSAQLGFDGSTLHLLAPPEEKIDIDFNCLSFTLPNGQVVLEGELCQVRINKFKQRGLTDPAHMLS
jgi:hypothetical protein